MAIVYRVLRREVEFLVFRVIDLQFCGLQIGCVCLLTFSRWSSLVIRKEALNMKNGALWIDEKIMLDGN